MTDIAKYVLFKGTALLIAMLAMSSPTLAAMAAAALDRLSLQKCGVRAALYSQRRLDSLPNRKRRADGGQRRQENQAGREGE